MMAPAKKRRKKRPAEGSDGASAGSVEEPESDALARDDDSTTRKKRRKATSPTARSLAEGRKRGYEIQVVERRVPRVFTTLDLFGVIDLVAIVPADGRPNRWCVVGIQATSGAHHADRRAKILAEPRAAKWVEAGCGLELWSWSLRVVGKARRWTLRVENYQEMRAAAPPSTDLPTELLPDAIAVHLQRKPRC